MFVEASALTAMMSCESDARVLAARLQRAQTRLTSPIAAFGAAAAVARLYELPGAEAEETVSRFLGLMGIQTLSLPVQATPLALQAHARFGEGTGSAAELTLADCFAYACARYYRQPLLYKTARFAQTDIEAG